MFLLRLFRFAMSAALLAVGMVVPAMAQIGLDPDTAGRLRELETGQFADADAADRANAALQSLQGATFPAVDAILDGPGDACAKLKAANDTLLRQLANAPLVEEQARQAIDARYGARLAALRQACDSNDSLFLDPAPEPSQPTDREIGLGLPLGLLSDQRQRDADTQVDLASGGIEAVLQGPGNPCAKLQEVEREMAFILDSAAPHLRGAMQSALEARYGITLENLRRDCAARDQPKPPQPTDGGVDLGLPLGLLSDQRQRDADTQVDLVSGGIEAILSTSGDPCAKLNAIEAEMRSILDSAAPHLKGVTQSALEARYAARLAVLRRACGADIGGLPEPPPLSPDQPVQPGGAIAFDPLTDQLVFEVGVATDSTTFCTFRPGNAESFLRIELTEQSPCEERGELERKRKGLNDTSQLVEAGGPPPSGFDPAQTARDLQQIDARLQELASICPSTSIESEEKSPATTAAEVPGEGSILIGPFPLSPVPEDLPPCEQLERLRLAASTEREHAANPQFAAEARLTALQNAEELEDRIRKVATECLRDAEPARGDALRESPFPIGPVSEKLPPCERAEALREALEKEVRNSGNMAFSQADREAAHERAVALEEQLQRALAECERSREGEFPKDETILDASDQFMQAPFPSSPVPEGLPPCERVTALREGLEKEIRDANTPSFSPADRTAARKRGMALEEQLQRALSECERTRSDPFPSPDQAPGSQSEKVVSQVTINVKATSRAVEEGRNAPELANQVIRLFGPEDLNVALPTAQGSKPQDGHDRDPVQVVTDDTGEATTSIRVPLRFAIGQSRETDSGVSLGPRVRLTFDATPQDSVNVIADKPDDLSRLLLRESLRESLIGIDRIGNLTVGTLQFDKDKAEEIGTLLRNDLPQVRVEPNLCRVKEPAAITEYHACKLGERRPPAGARILEPPGPHAELPGARITFGAIEQERGG